MVTWGEFRSVVRRSILKDPLETTWTNDMMRDYIGWALDTFCAHTAMATSTSFDCDGTQSVFTLPNNIYEPVDQAGVIYLQTDSAQAPATYLVPVYTTAGFNLQSENGFYCWPKNQLNCVVPPTSGYKLHIRYFAYYNHPSADSDTIDAPSWGFMPLSYMTAVHALSNLEAQEASLSRFDTKKDSGTPEDNATRSMQSWWIRLYETEINRHQRQSRVYAFKER